MYHYTSNYGQFSVHKVKIRGLLQQKQIFFAVSCKILYHTEYICWIISRILKWLVHKSCMCTCMSLDPGCHLCGYCGIMVMIFDWFGDWTLFEQMSIFMTRSF